MLWNYFANNYPDETWSTFAVLGCIAMAIAVPLSLLQRQIDFTPRKRYTSLYDESGARLEAAESESPTGVLQRALNIFAGNPNPPSPKSKGESPEDYRARVRGALRRRRRLP